MDKVYSTKESILSTTKNVQKQFTTSANLRLAVVGHTNTGKTSLLRTLLEDRSFGEIQNAPGTTRQVEGARIQVNAQSSIELYDTPGLEDGIGLYDYLDQLNDYHQQRLDGPESIALFLDSPESTGRFEQEARVLRQLLDSDAGLYVVDIRDPILAKHKDELAILARCGKPLIAILNFIHSENNYLAQWRETLARLGIHMSIEFDTVAPAIDGQAQLYQKLAVVLDKHSQSLEQLAQNIRQQRSLRKQIAQHMLADMLIDVAAFKISCQTEADTIKRQWLQVQETIRARENRFIKDLLTHYRFSPKDYPEQSLPIEGERWGMDLFNPDALVDMGIHVGKGFAAGAMAGAAIDVFTGGLSLGAAALVGGVAGGLWQGAEKIGKRLLGKIQGYEELGVDDAVIRLLGLRGLQLIDALEHRGHAAQDVVNLEQSTIKQWQEGKLPEALEQARAHPEWSRMGEHFDDDSARKKAVQSLEQHCY